jgi:UDP-N-acetylglucosamine 4,6-dehydratase
MISPDDSRRTLELDDRFVVNPIFSFWGYNNPIGKKVDEGYSYRSDTNTDWITEEDLRKFIGTTK